MSRSILDVNGLQRSGVTRKVCGLLVRAIAYNVNSRCKRLLRINR
jgi:hypothetical protein